jgi:hypothetical protein
VIWCGDDFYEDLDVASTVELIKALRRGEMPRPGSQTGRQASCPAGGATTLVDKPGKGGGSDAA